MYIKNFNRIDGNKLQNILIESFDGRSIAEILYSVIVAGEKSFQKIYVTTLL